LLSSLSEIYDIWTDCREDTAFGIVGCLAITRKRLHSGVGTHVTKQRLLHGVHVTISKNWIRSLYMWLLPLNLMEKFMFVE
jgi:hypothetical protein